MSADLTDLEILQLNPRKELSTIRSAIANRVAGSVDVGPLVRALADRDPVALVELLVGPRCLATAGMVRVALGVIDVLEGAISPNALYRRLCELAEESRLEVLDLAIARHPAEKWVVGLSRRVDPEPAGTRHLMALDDSETFFTVALIYARGGLFEALQNIASSRGRLEVLWVFAAIGEREQLVFAAAGILASYPQLPVVPTLAAVWSPSCEPLVCRMITEIKELSIARQVEPQLQFLPRARELLAAHIQHLSR